MSVNLLQTGVLGNLLLETHRLAHLLQFIPLDVLAQILLLLGLFLLSIHLQVSKSLQMSPISILAGIILPHRVGVVVDPVDLGLRSGLTLEYLYFLLNRQPYFRL